GPWRAAEAGRAAYLLEPGLRCCPDRFDGAVVGITRDVAADEPSGPAAGDLPGRIFQRHDLLPAAARHFGADARGRHGLQLSCALCLDAVAVLRPAGPNGLALGAGCLAGGGCHRAAAAPGTSQPLNTHQDRKSVV